MVVCAESLQMISIIWLFSNPFLER